jgi:hypothetical protein
VGSGRGLMTVRFRNLSRGSEEQSKNSSQHSRCSGWDSGTFLHRYGYTNIPGGNTILWMKFLVSNPMSLDLYKTRYSSHRYLVSALILHYLFRSRYYGKRLLVFGLTFLHLFRTRHSVTKVSTPSPHFLTGLGQDILVTVSIHAIPYYIFHASCH